jgi:hypothetical protein
VMKKSCSPFKWQWTGWGIPHEQTRPKFQPMTSYALYAEAVVTSLVPSLHSCNSCSFSSILNKSWIKIWCCQSDDYFSDFI